MATPTQTGIVNAALARLGSTRRIQSIDEGSSIANDALAIWDSTMRTLLAEHPWNWAIGRKTLNAGAPPAFGFAYGFTLPPDNLRWLPPADDDGPDFYTAREEGGVLLTDHGAAALPVRYISAELGGRVAVWPPYFVEAMTFAIAAELAEPLTQDTSLGDRMADKAEFWLKRAKRRDGLASNGRERNQVTARSSWLEARHRRYNRFER